MSITTESIKYSIQKLFLGIALRDRCYCSSSMDGLLGLKQIAQGVREGRSRCVKYCPCPHSSGSAWGSCSLFSWQEPTLPPFQTLGELTWKQMSLCPLSPIPFGNLNFGNLFCTELELGSSFKMQFSSLLSFHWLFSTEVWWCLAGSHKKTAENSFQYVCRPGQNVLQHYERF